MERSESISRTNCRGITRPEAVKLLQPVINLHGIELKDDRMEFPVAHPCVGAVEPESGEEKKISVILFKDVSSISCFKARIEVLLQSGELHSFSTTDAVRTHINTYTDCESAKAEKPITAWDVAENIWDGLEKTLASRKE